MSALNAAGIPIQFTGTGFASGEELCWQSPLSDRDYKKIGSARQGRMANRDAVSPVVDALCRIAPAHPGAAVFHRGRIWTTYIFIISNMILQK